ncbi:cytochrome P450 [Aulographum hederae CBS 113979]|uniref:Cytochrome P450 n=1 Tax=Aulographum hederae CBS 113979 TaxID=1176131 RepID=A0A6G1GLA4_9PEZI|nr:cytochrome P450 [Aulographum hederae CBS 113979]
MASTPMVIFIASFIASAFLKQSFPEHTLANSAFWTGLVIYLFSFSSFFVYRVIVYPKLISPLRHIPQPSNPSLLLGQFPRIHREQNGAPHRAWIEEVPNDGLIRYTHIFNSERVMVTSPKALAEVLVTKNYEFIKPVNIRHGLGRLLGIGILLAEGDEHKRQRKSLMPAFSYRHVKDLYPTFWAKAKEGADAIRKGIDSPESSDEKPSDVVNLRDWASRTTLDIIGLAGMGHDFNAIQNPESELNKIYRQVFSPDRGQRAIQLIGLIIPFAIVRRLPLKRNFQINEAAEKIKQVCRRLIAEKKQKLQKGQTGTDILSVALESSGFSDEDLVNQLMTFLAAGHETTASSMTWASYWLCRYPEVQQRLREEIRANLPSLSDTDATISSADVDSCHYLHAVCNEILRLSPPVALTMRVAANDSSIQGQFIPRGTTIVLSPWAVNTSRELWGDDAHQFNPDRWMGAGKANSGGAESNYAMMTFLHGPRSCIGQGFAKAEFACLLAAWIGRFEIELADKDYVLDVQSGVTSRPKGMDVKMRAVEGW